MNTFEIPKLKECDNICPETKFCKFVKKTVNETANNFDTYFNR